MKKILKKNKALFILPLVLLPFVVLIFYILGGGNPTGTHSENNQNEDNRQGANYTIPQAESSIEIEDKLEAYESQGGQVSTTDYHILEIPDSMKESNEVLLLTKDSADFISKNEEEELNVNVSNNLLAHIKQKEQEINRELNPPVRKTGKLNKTPVNYPISRKNTNETKRGSNQSNVVLQKTGIEQLDKVFEDNIVLSRQNDSLKFTLQQIQQQQREKERKQNARFTLEKKNGSGFQKEETKSNLITAEIYETTTVLDGNRVKLRLLEDTRIEGAKISRGTFLYGICKVKNERLHIAVSQMPVGENFLPVKLVIHDLDGLPGLYVPDNVARKITKEVGGSTNTSSLFGMTDNPLTYAGIRVADRTTQTLLKRVRLKKVTVRKNTLIYLINQNQ
ncbi:conjugative transposon protein TraM [Maribellus comscasis]|uniref:Conjugative transposon protein TraM n=1 Tax=Maribellus comscasis TaxID=2681766 RepID=A0A6I6JXA1_9BACT|nr:conjugative transposon protein TraM [Maribellus comscasis]QGY47715.1 conjugative transposon protein TraM [Maribellus comscasis]